MVGWLVVSHKPRNVLSEEADTKSQDTMNDNNNNNNNNNNNPHNNKKQRRLVVHLQHAQGAGKREVMPTKPFDHFQCFVVFRVGSVEHHLHHLLEDLDEVRVHRP